MNNHEKYDIKLASEVNIDALFTFYKLAYPDRHKLIFKYMKWYYRTSLFNLEPLVIEIDNEIVGHAGMMSSYLSYNNNIYKSIWFIDYIILPKYRGKGLGKILTKKWMDCCPTKLTFCNDHSLHIFKKFGWKEDKTFFRAAKILNYNKFIPIVKNMNESLLNLINFNKYLNLINKNKMIKPYPISGNHHHLLDYIFSYEKKLKDIKKIRILRDENWFYWRIMESPFLLDYYFFKTEESLIIVHKFFHKKIKRLNIILTLSSNKKDQINLFRSIIKWSVEENIDLIWLNSNDKIIKDNFKKILPNISNLNFAFSSVDKNLENTMNGNFENIQAIDGDNDLMYSNDN